MDVKSLYVLAEKEMIKMGFDTFYKGYYYLFIAVLYYLGMGYRKVSLRKEIYQRIAEEDDVTVESVESCIRNSIDKAWERNETAFRRAIKEYRGKRRTKPTNSEMIAIIASRIRLERIHVI